MYFWQSNIYGNYGISTQLEVSELISQTQYDDRLKIRSKQCKTVHSIRNPIQIADLFNTLIQNKYA